MLAIEIRFPTGRYHATPWDQHVNEGVVEWPPCPFRLLRAIVATWHLKARTEIPEAEVTALVEKLASTRPSYYLPPAIAAHTRHYMPIGQIEDGIERTTKIFDTFMHIADKPIGIVWPAMTLDDGQERTLDLLLQKLAYLGRAESWVEAKLLPGAGSEAADIIASANVVPFDPARGLSSVEELIRVLCPMPSCELVEWRARAFEQELERRLEKKRQLAQAKSRDSAAQKLTKADKDKVDAMLPRTLMDMLQVDTGELRRQGWNGVPGTQWVDYVRLRDQRSMRVTTTIADRSVRPNPTVARFAVASQVPPRLTNGVSLAELIRVALMSRSDGASVFSGKDAQGHPARGHRHAYILPEANARHGRITHVTLYAPGGFDISARRALDDLRKVRGRGGHDVQLVLLGVGGPEDFAGMNLEAGQCSLLEKSDRWISRTPFVPTRHAKATRRGKPKLDAEGLQIGSPEHDLRRLLREMELEPLSVEPVDSTDLSGKRTSWLEFDTMRRRGDGLRGSTRGFGFRLTFAQAVRGPIAVGYGAHFGLGVFVPE